MSRALIILDAASRNAGVTIVTSRPEEIREINRSNRTTWRTLNPIFDPTFDDVSDANTRCIVGLSRNGTPIATHMVRIFECGARSFLDIMEEWWREYKDRWGHDGTVVDWKANGDAASVMKGMTGSVAVCGATWYSPEFRGRGLSELIPRLGRVNAFIDRPIGHFMSLVSDRLISHRGAEVLGFANMAWEVEARSMGKPVRMGCLWETADEFIDILQSDLDNFAGRLAQSPREQRVISGATNILPRLIN